jgi:hypothetical protein
VEYLRSHPPQIKAWRVLALIFLYPVNPHPRVIYKFDGNESVICCYHLFSILLRRALSLVFAIAVHVNVIVTVLA